MQDFEHNRVKHPQQWGVNLRIVFMFVLLANALTSMANEVRVFLPTDAIDPHQIAAIFSKSKMSKLDILERGLRLRPQVSEGRVTEPGANNSKDNKDVATRCNVESYRGDGGPGETFDTVRGPRLQNQRADSSNSLIPCDKLWGSHLAALAPRKMDDCIRRPIDETRDPRLVGALGPKLQRNGEVLNSLDCLDTKILAETSTGASGELISTANNSVPNRVALVIEFNIEKGEFSTRTIEQLALLAIGLKQVPRNLLISGHNNTADTALRNYFISTLCAAAIKEVLVERFQIPQSRLRVLGFGDTAPLLAQNTNAAQNNRVEFAVDTSEPLENSTLN